jgi:hypothetical protein
MVRKIRKLKKKIKKTKKAKLILVESREQIIQNSFEDRLKDLNLESRTGGEFKTDISKKEEKI